MIFFIVRVGRKLTRPLSKHHTVSCFICVCITLGLGQIYRGPCKKKRMNLTMKTIDLDFQAGCENRVHMSKNRSQTQHFVLSRYGSISDPLEADKGRGPRDRGTEGAKGIRKCRWVGGVDGQMVQGSKSKGLKVQGSMVEWSMDRLGSKGPKVQGRRGRRGRRGRGVERSTGSRGPLGQKGSRAFASIPRFKRSYFLT